jgi:hypothetical protein
MEGLNTSGNVARLAFVSAGLGGISAGIGDLCRGEASCRPRMFV